MKTRPADKRVELARLLGATSSPAPASPAERTLLTFPRGQDGAKQLRVGVSTFQGKTFLSLAVWFRGNGGAWCPTKQVVTVRRRELDAVVAALQGLQAEWRDKAA